MGLKETVKRLEQQSGITCADGLCVCSDALALMGTEYAKACFKCGRAIDLRTWKHWHLIQPTAETNFFAFGLLRDDNLSDGM